MLDVNDFIAERGGNPEKIRESQRRRFANVEVVDEVIALWDDHRRSKFPLFYCPVSIILGDLAFANTFSTAQYSATQLSGQINDIQKQIATKKKVDSICLP